MRAHRFVGPVEEIVSLGSILAPVQEGTGNWKPSSFVRAVFIPLFEEGVDLNHQPGLSLMLDGDLRERACFTNDVYKTKRQEGKRPTIRACN